MTAREPCPTCGQPTERLDDGTYAQHRLLPGTGLVCPADGEPVVITKEAAA